ncbi:isoeugenol synthase 1-like [Cryptomeria japonica]|uniref:isoeugenol synthase 1-like n=1 Tax=Cryptomeria japonica TaxID=3369 RepID=UPI0027DA6283|nr:isoeugenol synthase 1-like [Cryptomeria japonica]XP_059064446.1 isoeugenol synthase 1-like [Cryptomeria japonica]
MSVTAERQDGENNRIMLIGGTGYLGKYMAKASVSLGYPTSVLVRPESLAPHSSKARILQDFTDMGIHILQGSLDDYESLASAYKQVDILISTLAIPQHMDQLKIIRAIQEVGNFKILFFN